MSTDHTEQEVKLTLVDTQVYEALCAKLGPLLDVHFQENLYFDTSSRSLHKVGAMLRVRIVGDRVKVTAKSGAIIQEGVLTCREIEETVSRENWERQKASNLLDWEIAPVTHIRSFLMEEETLVYLGAARNERRFFNYLEDVTLEVDRTSLPGGVIHVELEAETNSPAEIRASLERFLDREGFAFSREVVPKVQRFLDALDG